MQTPSQPYSHSVDTVDSRRFGATPITDASASNSYASFGQPLPALVPSPAREHVLDVNTQDGDGRTQLHRAVINGSHDVASTLLTSGAAVHIKDHSGNEPLHYAVLGSFQTIVKLLLRFGANPDSKGQLGRSALHMSVEFQPVLKVLLNTKPSLSCQDENGSTPLHLAASRISLSTTFPSIPSVIKLLLQAGADVNMANNDGVTPFHLIVDQDHSTTSFNPYSRFLSMFLKSGANISLPSRDHKLPFEVFLERSRSSWTQKGYHGIQNWNARDCFKSFVGKGADVDTIVESGELLSHEFFRKHYSPKWADDEIAQLFCENGDPNRIGQSGDSLLHLLTEHALFECRGASFDTLVRIVLNRGGNPNQRNRLGKSPLMTLLRANRRKDTSELLGAMEILLKWGADPMTRDLSGDLPIYVAVRNFPELAARLGKILLVAYLGYEGSHQARKASNGGIETTDELWWKDWELAVTNGYPAIEYWESVKQTLSRLRPCLPSDVETAVYSIAVGTLVDHLLEAAKDLAQSMENPRAYVVTILRDIRRLKLDVNSRWFDFLFDLCL